MTRSEIRAQVRLRSLVESTNVSDTEINDLIDESLEIINAYYPYPGVTITTLAADGNSPAFNAGFHWLCVSYALARVWEREEYPENAAVEFERFYSGMSDMIKFYVGGRS